MVVKLSKRTRSDRKSHTSAPITNVGRSQPKVLSAQADHTSCNVTRRLLSVAYVDTISIKLA